MFHFTRKRNRENVSVMVSSGSIRAMLIFLICVIIIICTVLIEPASFPNLAKQFIKLVASAVKGG